MLLECKTKRRKKNPFSNRYIHQCTSFFVLLLKKTNVILMAGDRRRCDTCAPKHTVEKKQCYATLKNGNRERKRERKMTLAILMIIIFVNQHYDNV
jgi:hypothetical protein